jgi:transcriptional regulator with XRE-family HTH domain
MVLLKFSYEVKNMHKRIRLIRNFLKLSLDQFSRELKIDFQKLYDIENNNVSASEELIEKICDTYAVNKTWLYNGHGLRDDLFLKDFANLSDLSTLKKHLIKLVLSIDDYIIDDVFLDIQVEGSNVTVGEFNDDLEQLVMSYENELNSEKNGIML